MDNISAKLDDIFFSISSCKLCNLSKKCEPITGISGINGLKTPRITIVLSNPTKEMTEQRDVFEGVVGEYLKKLTEKAGINPKNVNIGFLVNCSNSYNKEPDEQYIDICSSWLTTQINLCEPKVLIACGKETIRHLLNIKRKTIQLKDYIGNEYPYGNFYTKVIPAYSINYCLRHGWPTQQKMLEIFRKAREMGD